MRLLADLDVDAPPASLFPWVEDLDRYPRTLDADLEVCATEGVDVVFAPGVEEMYPGGFSHDSVRDGVTGLLVPDRDPGALARAIDRMLGDAALRWRLGREGVRWAAQHRWPCVAEAICREYAALEPAARAHLAAGHCV